MAGTRKVYTPEFKLAAVKVIADQKLSVAEVARRLGVAENRVHDGKKAVVKKGVDAFPASGHLTPVDEDLRQLRADVARLEMGRDSLKKAAAFFATQMTRSPPGSRNARARGPSCRCAGCWRRRGRGGTRGGRGTPARRKSGGRSRPPR